MKSAEESDFIKGIGITYKWQLATAGDQKESATTTSTHTQTFLRSTLLPRF